MHNHTVISRKEFKTVLEKETSLHALEKSEHEGDVESTDPIHKILANELRESASKFMLGQPSSYTGKIPTRIFSHH